MAKQSNRVSPEDAKTSIFHPNASIIGNDFNREITQKVTRDVQCFTIFGKHEHTDNDGSPVVEDEDSQNVLAKIVKINENPKYLIKRDSNGRLFNPLGIDEGNHNKFIHRAGRNEYEFREVGYKTFTFYLTFLRTKNLAQLRNAEREGF